MQFPRLSNSLKIPPFKATLVYLVYLLNSILVLASLAPEFRTPFPPFKFEFLKFLERKYIAFTTPFFCTFFQPEYIAIAVLLFLLKQSKQGP